MNRLQKSLILLVCFITLILVGVMGVWYNAQNQGLTSPLFFPPPDYLQISQPLPNQTYPIPPNGSLTICLWLSAKLLLQSDDKLVKSEWWHTNTKLWLDQIDVGQPHHWLDLLGADTTGNEYGPYEYCWFVKNVSAGWHIAKYQITDTAGVNHSYQWVFFVTTP